MNKAKNMHLKRGFSLVELLVSLVVLSIVGMVSYGALELMQRSWLATSARAEQFREARAAFEAVARNLSQASLNTYIDYFYKATGTNVPPSGESVAPSAYVRQSELQFYSGDARDIIAPGSEEKLHPGHAVFFQATLGQSRQYRGLPNLLNARGYFIQFLDDTSGRPDFLPPDVTNVRFRYRLMEYRPPAERVGDNLPGNAIYALSNTWFREGINSSSRIIADNVILMLVAPLVPPGMMAGDGRQPWWIAPAYRYNSRDCDNSTPAIDPITVNQSGEAIQGTRHLLPPQIRFTLVALDEHSARRWSQLTGGVAVNLRQEAHAEFKQPELYQRDLERLTQYLVSHRLNYRVFSEVISLRNARWDSQAFKIQ
jgi:uncharacterized protein (TIGR02599 family)